MAVSRVFLAFCGQYLKSNFRLYIEEGNYVQLPDHQTLLNSSQGELVANVIGLIDLNLILQGVVLGTDIVLLAVEMQRRSALWILIQLDVEIFSVLIEFSIAYRFEIPETEDRGVIAASRREVNKALSKSRLQGCQNSEDLVQLHCEMMRDVQWSTRSLEPLSLWVFGEFICISAKVPLRRRP